MIDFNRMELLEIKQLEDGKYAILIDFEMKEDLKQMVSSAKWNKGYKIWIAGPRSLSNLQDFVAYAKENYDLAYMRKKNAKYNDASVRFVDHVYHFKTKKARWYIDNLLAMNTLEKVENGDKEENVVKFKGKTYLLEDEKQITKMKSRITKLKNASALHKVQYALIDKPKERELENIQTVIARGSEERVLVGIISIDVEHFLKYNVATVMKQNSVVSTSEPALYEQAEKALYPILEKEALEQERKSLEKKQTNKQEKLEYSNLETLVKAVKQAEKQFIDGFYTNYTDSFYGLLLDLEIEENKKKMKDVYELIVYIVGALNYLNYEIHSTNKDRRDLKDKSVTVVIKNEKYEHIDIEPILEFFGLEASNTLECPKGVEKEVRYASYFVQH